MSTLITGGLGIIGSWATRQLVERGERVVVYARHADYALLGDLRDRFAYVAGDIGDAASVFRTVQEHGVRRIVHLASAVPPLTERNPYLGFPLIVQGTLNLLEAARLAGAERFVYASSKSVYADVTGRHAPPELLPIAEDYPRVPSMVYGAAKLACELLGERYAASFGVDWVALRFAPNYGPLKVGRHGLMLGHGAMIENAALGRPTRLEHGADYRDDLIYTRDIARGIVAALDAPQLAHRAYHLGLGRAVSLQEIADAVRAIVSTAQIAIGPGEARLPSGGANACVFDIRRARTELGWEPAYPPAAAVRDYLDVLQRFKLAPTPT